MKGEYDYVVVGGGTAGAVVARRLADAGCGTVALLEAGPSDEHDARILELSRWGELLGSELDYDYAIAPQQRGNSRIRHSRGRMLGGCSSHNSAIAFTPPAADFRRWAALGGEGWGPERVAPYFARMRERVHLEKSSSENRAVEAFLSACEQAGMPRVDFFQPPTEGADWFALNKRGPIRQSSSVAYLHPVNELPEALDVVTGVSATRIRIDRGRARAVETTSGEIAVGVEVILCTGAFDSPKLLMLSGVGAADHLRSMAVDVVVDSPAVGENLIDHPEGVVVFEAALPVPEETAQRYEAGCLFKTSPELEVADVMLHFGTEAFDMWTASSGYETADNALSMTPNVTRARSQGTVRLGSADPGAPPAIDFRYFTDPEGYDESTMVAGIELCRRLAAQPALKPWIARELAPGPAVTSFEALSRYARTTANTVYHPAGTCRLGTGGDSVVDAELRVRGVDNLRVADASVFPEHVSVNPCLTCMMIGERCAAFIIGTAS